MGLSDRSVRTIFICAKVRTTIETPDEPSDILELATSVYEGLTDAEIDEIEEIAFDRTSFFRDRE